MVDQFEDEKLPSCGTPHAIQMVQIPGPGLKVGAKPRGLPRGMLALGID